jgi:hypothetical protein
VDYIYPPDSDEKLSIQALTKNFDSMNLMKDRHFYLTKSQKNKWKLYSDGHASKTNESTSHTRKRSKEAEFNFDLLEMSCQKL